MKNIAMKAMDQVTLEMVTILGIMKPYESIRKCIYATNWIERFNKEVRRLTKTKDSLPTEDVCSKLVYKIIQYNETWSTKKLRGFTMAYDTSGDV